MTPFEAFFKRSLFLSIVCVSLISPLKDADAIIVNSSGIVDYYQEDPVDIPGWVNVGIVGLGSGIYIGDGYILTSSHVGCHPFVLDDIVYHPKYDTWRILKNHDGSDSDIALFQISSTISKLLPISIRSSNTTLHGDIIMIGVGCIEHTPPKKSIIGATLGYHIKAHRVKRWGINSVYKFISRPVNTAGPYKTYCFVSSFDHIEGDTQAVSGDSGGVAFSYNEKLNRWELAGCIIAASQLNYYIPFGARTYFGDLAAYWDQLPEMVK